MRIQSLGCSGQCSAPVKEPSAMTSTTLVEYDDMRVAPRMDEIGASAVMDLVPCSFPRQAA